MVFMININPTHQLVLTFTSAESDNMDLMQVLFDGRPSMHYGYRDAAKEVDVKAPQEQRLRHCMYSLQLIIVLFELFTPSLKDPDVEGR